MSINSRIEAALKPVVPIVEPNFYSGGALEYIIFTSFEDPVLFAESKPNGLRHLAEIHWFCRRGINPFAKQTAIKNALFNAGFTYPSITNASDKDSQHYIFECEFVEAANV